jgi:hypothetical protein
MQLLTSFINMVFTLLHFSLKHPAENSWLVGNSPHNLGQKCDFFTGNFKLLDSFTYNSLVETTGIDIGCIPCCESYQFVIMVGIVTFN